MAHSRERGLRIYIIRRLLLMIPTFIGVTALVFLLTQLVPGGPIDQLRLELAAGGGLFGEAGTAGDGRGSMVTMSDADLQNLREYYGFDKPINQRYWLYMTNLVQLDLGTSFRYTMPASEIIFRRIPISLYYGIVTMILTYGICIPLGVVKAIRHKTFVDNSTSVLIFLGYAVPNFALGAVLLAIFSVQLGWFPLGGFRGEDFEELTLWARVRDVAHHSVLPLICYMVGSFAILTMLMKNSLMENMSADYVKAALARGMTWPRAVFIHAFRNSLIPLATGFGNNISILLAGSLLIERVFNIPGMGLLFFEAVQARDYPVVMGLTVIGSILLLFGNLLSDICVALVDPRVRFV